MRTPKFWRTKNLLSHILLPLSAIYGAGAWLDRRFTASKKAALPVISVGNATAGGAGKTPTALALQSLLSDLGFDAHFITRGYGRTGSSMQAHRVQLQDDWQQVGDEPLLLAQAAPTWVCAKRLAAAEAAQQAGADMVIADDALQHHALRKDLSFLVIDGQAGIGNGYLMPAGPLREPFAAALGRCDAVVLIGEDRHQLTPRINKPIFRAHIASHGDTTWVTNKLFAFAGIAYPEKFYQSLRAHGTTQLTTKDFPDHHPYTRAQIETLLAQAEAMDAMLVTTAKDIVKIPADLRARIHVFHVALRWDDEAKLRQWLQEKLPKKSR